jgi:hypothetical protein
VDGSVAPAAAATATLFLLALCNPGKIYTGFLKNGTQREKRRWHLKLGVGLKFINRKQKHLENVENCVWWWG